MVDKIWYNMEELIGGSEERVLIETYWNVNLIASVISLKLKPVLIETYWNVNSESYFRNLRIQTVLIETYWNVNV